jgi:hypothetical protein
MGPRARLRREPKFRKAWGPFLWFLKRYEFWAVPMPWRTVYVIKDKLDSEVLREHERVHYEQMEREGMMLWHLKYLVFLLKFGYRNNPYEVEAYRRFGS